MAVLGVKMQLIRVRFCEEEASNTHLTSFSSIRIWLLCSAETENLDMPVTINYYQKEQKILYLARVS